MLKNFILMFLISLFNISLFAKELNIYSYRHYDLDGKLFKMFEEKTGIKVNSVTGKANSLLKRLESEGKNSPADLVITADAGILYRAKEKALLQSVYSKVLEKKIPSIYMDPDKKWFAFSKRARIAVYTVGKVDPKDIKTYEDLAKPKFKGKIMIRSSNNIYNQSLLSAMIAHNGVEYAQKWAKAIVSNMARPPKGNDRAQAVAIANGIGDIAIINTYYLGKMVNNKKNKKQRDAAKKIKMAFPVFAKSKGVHMNVSGVGVAKYAKNKENAVKFIEFLLSDEVQELLVNVNYEYPIVKNIKLSKLMKSWGTSFKEDTLPVYLLGKFNTEAVKVFDKAGWR